MRINNPRGIAGFTINGTVDEAAYKIITINQLEQAIAMIDKKFTDLLAGKADTHFGLSGIITNNGYVYFNNDGKIDKSFLPVSDTDAALTRCINEIYDTIGNVNENANSDISGTIYSQLKSIRQDISTLSSTLSAFMALFTQPQS